MQLIKLIKKLLSIPLFIEIDMYRQGQENMTRKTKLQTIANPELRTLDEDEDKVSEVADSQIYKLLL